MPKLPLPVLVSCKKHSGHPAVKNKNPAKTDAMTWCNLPGCLLLNRTSLCQHGIQTLDDDGGGGNNNDKELMQDSKLAEPLTCQADCIAAFCPFLYSEFKFLCRLTAFHIFSVKNMYQLNTGGNEICLAPHP